MNPDRHFGLVSRGLFVGAALLALAPGAIAQDRPQNDADLINAIPAPTVEQPRGLEGPQTAQQPNGTPMATAPVATTTNEAPASAEDIK
jgi:hypothetical protein